MKNKSLVRALEKEGLKVEKDGPARLCAIKGTKIVSWVDQEGKAINIHCTRLNDGRDSQTDYFPGYYVKTIKRVIKHLGEK